MQGHPPNVVQLEQFTDAYSDEDIISWINRAKDVALLVVLPNPLDPMRLPTWGYDWDGGTLALVDAPLKNMMNRVFGKRAAPVVLEKDIVFPDSEGPNGNAVVSRLPREGLSWMVMEVSHPAFGQEVILSDVAVCVGDDALDIVSGIPVHLRLVTTIGISSARDACLEDTRFA